MSLLWYDRGGGGGGDRRGDSVGPGKSLEFR